MAMWTVNEWESASSAGLLARRTHPVLKDIDRLVRAYHLITGMEADSVPKRTAFLAAIISRTGIYLSQHVDKKARRGAVETLRQQATDEIKRLPRPEEKRRGWDGIRYAGQLQGVKDRSHVSAGAFQPAIKMSHDYYLLEAFNPAHVPADQATQDELEAWATRACKAENMSFHAMKAAARQRYQESLPPAARKSAGVTYLTDNELEGYRVSLTPAGLTWACEEGPLHSIGIPGPEDEANKFIFVISPGREMFAGEPVFQKFHHSSFLQGRPVLGAGTIEVSKGTLLKVTNSSGHYRPDLSRHYNTLLFLRQKGLVLSSIQSVAFGHKPQEATAQEHFDQLRAKLGKATAAWKMDPGKKLELFRAMEPQAREKFLRERGESEAIYVNNLLREQQQAILEREQQASLERQAHSLFGASRGSDEPEFMPIKAD
jgi:hypothetical protein